METRKATQAHTAHERESERLDPTEDEFYPTELLTPRNTPPYVEL